MPSPRQGQWRHRHRAARTKGCRAEGRRRAVSVQPRRSERRRGRSALQQLQPAADKQQPRQSDCTGSAHVNTRQPAPTHRRRQLAGMRAEPLAACQRCTSAPSARCCAPSRRPGPQHPRFQTCFCTACLVAAVTVRWRCTPVACTHCCGAPQACQAVRRGQRLAQGGRGAGADAVAAQAVRRRAAATSQRRAAGERGQESHALKQGERGRGMQCARQSQPTSIADQVVSEAAPPPRTSRELAYDRRAPRQAPRTPAA